MRILSRLRMLVFGAIGSVLVLTSFLIGSLLEFNTATVNHALVDTLRNKVFDTVSLRDQYFLYREERAKTQWFEKTEEIRLVINRALQQITGAEDQQRLQTLRRSFETSITSIFPRIVSNSVAMKTAGTDAQMVDELNKKLMSQLLVNTTIIQDETIALQAASNARVRDAYVRLIGVTVIFSVVLSLVIALTLLFVSRLIRKRLLQLHTGTGVIAAGNLDCRLEVQGRDELADVARSVNLMADKLQANTKQLEADVAERKKSEQVLGQSEARFRQFFERNTSVMMLIEPQSGEILGANQSALAYYGYPLDRMVGALITQINTLSPEETAQERQRALREDRNYFNFHHRLASGEVRDVEVYSTPTQVDGKTLLFSIVHDITARNRAEETVKSANRQYQELLSAASEFSIILTDKDGLIQMLNRGTERMLGYHSAEMVGQAALVALHVAEEVQQRGDELSQELGRAVAGFEVFVAKPNAERQERREWTYVCKDGSRLPVSLVVTAVRSAKGEISGYLGIAQDISDKKCAEEKLQLAANVFTHAREGIMITDADGTIVDVNETFTRITGYRRAEAVGQNPRLLKSGRQAPEDYASMWKSLIDKDHWSGEMWNRRKSGEIYAVMQSVSAVRDASGKKQNYVALFSDITSMKEYEQQLEHIAHYDALTHLPNRVLLADRLRQAIIQSQRRKNSLAVVFLDLDGFKAVNDTHGHDVGDALLIALSQRMKAVLRDGDTLARIGGDEFVALLVDLEQAKDCELVLARMLLAASDPVLTGETVLQVSASMGVTLYPQDGSDADMLLRHADQAMYSAKQAGCNRYHLFDTEKEDAVKAQRESLKHMRRALDQHEFVLYYQPKVNMKTGVVVGAEALIRWQHPERGLLAPGTFLPSIEDQPISVEVGEWVIATALAQMVAWQDCGLQILVSVNIGARQLQQDGFATRLNQLLAAYPDVQPHWLQLEVLETSAFEDLPKVSAAMHACHTMGVSFALDDFGTGYSSLTHLRHLPIETLKIDQSFVRDMLDDPNDLAIVNGVIGLAKAFGRRVIAEGVETAAHGELLLSIGCEQAQGYGIARPMPAADLPDWVTRWHSGAVWTA